jgi:hypothetical protein
VGFRDRLQQKAIQYGEEARAKAVTSVPVQVAGDGLRGFLGLLEGEDDAFTVDLFLLSLVRAVRDDERDERSKREVYVAARKRRRRLGLAAFATGPLVGVANQVADLYCEAAVICDLAAFHRQELSDEQVVAHLLVLWNVADGYEAAHASVQGNPPISSLLGDRLFLEVDEYLPEELTKRSIAKALWEVREGVGGVRKGATTEAVRTVAFTGHRTKKTIKRLEVQLGVGRT